MGKRMSARLNCGKLQLAVQGSHHHHLTCNIVERHAEQSRVARVQTKEIARHAGRSHHAALLHPHQLRSSRRSAGMHLYTVVAIMPFFQKLLKGHQQKQKYKKITNLLIFQERNEDESFLVSFNTSY